MKYHFHVSDGRVISDEDGEELGSLEAACDVAVALLAENLPNDRDAFLRDRRFSVNVKDGEGRMVIVLTTTLTMDPDTAGRVPPCG